MAYIQNLTRIKLIVGFFSLLFASNSIVPFAVSANSISCSANRATVFYVAPFGNDAWSGRLAHANRQRTDGPFATLLRARDSVRMLKGEGRLKGPVIIYIRGGLYFLPEPLVFTTEDSGTLAAPITYVAYRDETPILSGGRLISDWKPSERGLYTTLLPEVREGKWKFRQLFVNGERRYRARTPNSGFLQVAELPGVDLNGKYNTPANNFRFALGDLSSRWINLTDVEVVMLHFWVDTHLPIATIDEGTQMVTFSRRSRRRFTESFRGGNARYYVDNVYEGLDQPAEWYLNRKTGVLSYLPKPGEDMSKAQVIAPRLTTLIRFDGQPEENKFIEYINLRGLTFSHNEWELPPDDAGDVTAANEVPAAVLMRGLRNSRIQDSTFLNLGTYAIELGDGSTNNLINGNEIVHAGAGGIMISGGDVNSSDALRTSRNQITNNHLHHLGEIFHSGVGILSRHAAGNRIAHNLIDHTYYTAISVGWVWGYEPSISRDNIIEYNYIHTIGQGLLNDMGGIYLLGPAPGTVVRNNLIHDVRAYRFGGWGIYADEGSSSLLIENNLVYRTTNGGFNQHYGRDNEIRNNIFALGQEEQITRIRAESHLSFTFERNIVYWDEGPLLGRNWDGGGYSFNHNLYFKKGGRPIQFANWSFAEWQKRGQDTEGLIADPLFVDPVRGDFSLEAQSPAFKLGFQPVDISQIGLEQRYRKRLH